MHDPVHIRNRLKFRLKNSFVVRIQLGILLFSNSEDLHLKDVLSDLISSIFYFFLHFFSPYNGVRREVVVSEIHSRLRDEDEAVSQQVVARNRSKTNFHLTKLFKPHLFVLISTSFTFNVSHD